MFELFFFFFSFFRAATVAYGSSQARDTIRATAASLHQTTETQDLSHVCDLHHSLHQCRVLNPLNEARDRTRVLTDASRIHFCCTMMRTPELSFFNASSLQWTFSRGQSSVLGKRASTVLSGQYISLFCVFLIS